MLRTGEAQAILRTVFSLWFQHHSYIKSRFRLRIRAHAFLKSHLASRVLRAWTRAIHTRRKLELKGLEVASTHRKVLKDKALAGLLTNILHRKARRKRILVADRLYEMGLRRRSVRMMKEYVGRVLWKVEASRSALLAWRNTKLATSVVAWREGLQALTKDNERRTRADAGFSLYGLRKGLHRLRSWATGRPLRERLRLEALFAWKRRSLKTTFRHLLERCRGGRARREATEEVQRRAGKWALNKAIRRMFAATQRRKWAIELICLAENMKNVTNPLKRGLGALRQNAERVIMRRKEDICALKLRKLQLFRRFKSACLSITMSKEENTRKWHKHRLLTVLFQAWFSAYASAGAKANQQHTALTHYASSTLYKVVKSWKTLARSRNSQLTAFARAKRLITQKRTKRLLRYWVMRKRHKEEFSWKRTMAESQDKLRLFRMLMNACAERLHLRRTKEYAAETYRNHFIGRVFRGWQRRIRREAQIREIWNGVLIEKYRKVFEAWNKLSRKSHLYEELEKTCKKVRLKWLKKTVLRGMRLYMEMDMGAIAKRRQILHRRQDLLRSWALQCWKKGISNRREAREKQKILKTGKGRRILKKVMIEWSSKLQQKTAKRAIKERKVAQAQGSIQKLRMRLYYAKWRNYHQKRGLITAKYQLSQQLYCRQNKRKFYYKLRIYHQMFRFLQGKIDLANGHFHVSLLKKSLKGLILNIALRRKEREKLSISLHYWAQRRYKNSLEGLMQYTASKRWKRKMEAIALEMRRGDLVSSALVRVQRVGTEWKQERLKIATKARVQREQRVWKLVAKFAQRWKAKTIQRRKMRETEAIARQKTALLPTKAVPLSKDSSPVFLQDKTVSRSRPQPRRPAFLSSALLPPSHEVAISPIPSPPVHIPPRTQPQSPRSRLEAIESELMTFKFEKEKIVKYESYVNANPGNTVLKAQLVKMKDRLNERKPRVKVLLEEVDRLKSVA